MEMPIERIHANPAVKADVGRIAIQRGPIVYCLEGADNAASGGHVRDLVLTPDAAMNATFRTDLLGGVGVITGSTLLPKPRDWRRSLYAGAESERVTFTAVPYCVWDNREPGEMVVWLPESAAFVGSHPDPGIRASASYCWRADSVGALFDGLEPSSSSDGSIPRTTFWPHKGTAEWAQYDFDTARSVSGVEVYFFDDSKQGGGCRVPATWRVMYRDGDVWKPAPQQGGTLSAASDRFNRAEFAPVTTTALRLEIQLQEGSSAGILEWRVIEAE
jgi:hypothetical protein